jgi:hypothetical protein
VYIKGIGKKKQKTKTKNKKKTERWCGHAYLNPGGIVFPMTYVELLRVLGHHKRPDFVENGCRGTVPDSRGVRNVEKSVAATTATNFLIFFIIIIIIIFFFL